MDQIGKSSVCQDCQGDDSLCRVVDAHEDLDGNSCQQNCENLSLKSCNGRNRMCGICNFIVAKAETVPPKVSCHEACMTLDWTKKSKDLECAGMICLGYKDTPNEWCML